MSSHPTPRFASRCRPLDTRPVAASLRPAILRWAGFLPVGLLIAAALGGCEIPGAGESEAAELSRAPIHVDSVFPPEEELRRFREDTEEVQELAGGAGSRESLVESLIDALERADTAAVLSLALTRDEFAWLYYPHTMYTSRPYQLSPALVWYHQQNRSSRGLTRLLSRYLGEELHYSETRCPDDGEGFGEGWIWHECTVLGELPTGEQVEERLFGSILEWNGRYKLVSFSNEF